MEAVLELILPTIMAYMINDGVVRHDLQVVIRLGLLMIVMVIVGFGFSMGCQYNAALASQGVGTDTVSYTHLKIRKRDGREIYFAPEKITRAIFLAASKVAEDEGQVADYATAEQLTLSLIHI